MCWISGGSREPLAMPAFSVGFLSPLWHACPSLQGEGSQAGLCSFPFSTFLLFYLHLYPRSQFHKCNNLRIASSSIFLIWKTTRQKESWREKHFHKAKLSCDGNLIITIREQNWVYLSPSLFPLGWFLLFVFLCYHHSPLLFCRKELDTRTEIICAYASCGLSKTLVPLPSSVCLHEETHPVWGAPDRVPGRGSSQPCTGGITSKKYPLKPDGCRLWLAPAAAVPLPQPCSRRTAWQALTPTFKTSTHRTDVWISVVFLHCYI